ncbi:Uncharacterised protein [Achromobacter xylosoxidans]|nr:Uncharacterised protein [Achromobacter xylosoxidans]
MLGAASGRSLPASSTRSTVAATSGARRSTSRQTMFITSTTEASLTMACSTRRCSTSCTLVGVMSVNTSTMLTSDPRSSNTELAMTDTHSGLPPRSYTSTSL